MNRTKALALGALTLWPLAYVMLFLAAMAYLAIFRGDGSMPPYLALIFIVHLLTMGATLGLLVFYMVHLFRNEAVPQEQKALWAVVLFLGNVLSMPVYWYLYIWAPPADET